MNVETISTTHRYPHASAFDITEDGYLVLVDLEGDGVVAYPAGVWLRVYRDHVASAPTTTAGVLS